jgi:hypothetical protein
MDEWTVKVKRMGQSQKTSNLMNLGASQPNDILIESKWRKNKDWKFKLVIKLHLKYSMVPKMIFQSYIIDLDVFVLPIFAPS